MILRKWTYVLYSGLATDTCMHMQMITFDNQFHPDSIVWPDDTIELTNCNGSVDTADINQVPVIRGEYCGEVVLSFDDTEVTNPNDACREVQREWTVTNLCEENEQFRFVQTIILRNYSAPVLTGPADVTINNDPGQCEAFVNLAAVVATECSPGVEIVNDYNNGGANASGVYPVGVTTVTFTATDSCANTATVNVTVTVIDSEPPQVMCPSDTTIHCDEDISDLSRFGVLSATDNCVVDSIVLDTIFDLNICNVGTITRSITAFDEAGLVAQCQQVITIDNPGAITIDDITWPDDTVVINGCESSHPDSTGRPEVDVSGATCHRISINFEDTTYMTLCNGDSCTIIEREWTVIDSCQFDGVNGRFVFTQIIQREGGMIVTIMCPADTTIFCDDDLTNVGRFGNAMVNAQCGLDTMTMDTIYNLNLCNVGTITRRFTAIDSFGNAISCDQTITVTLGNPFTEQNITWPEDSVFLSNCQPSDPDSTGRPVIDTSNVNCHMISVTFVDSMYRDLCGMDSCTFIKRTWLVVDSCQHMMMGDPGRFEFCQIIVIDGRGSLEVTCPADTTITCDMALGDLSQYGDVMIRSFCGLDTLIRDTLFELNTCGVGKVTRTFTALDSVGNQLSCSQMITITIANPIDLSDITWPPDTVNLTNCSSLDPDSLLNGNPIVDTSMASCFALNITFEDSSSSSCTSDPCLVVFRDWTVKDSCQFDGTMGSGVFTFRQVINVFDTTAPVITANLIDTTITLPEDTLRGQFKYYGNGDGLFSNRHHYQQFPICRLNGSGC